MQQMQQMQQITFETPDLQQQFQWVYTNLWHQNKLSMSFGRCCLRGSNETKCALGWLIPDAEYDPSMEKDFSLFLPEKNYYFYDIIRTRLHDDLKHKQFNYREHLNQAAADIAKEFGWEFTPLH